MEVQLISAIREGDVETLKELLNDPANEGYTFTFMGGATPLHWAAQEGQQEALGLFLERATNAVDTKDSTGSTPLHWAADEGQVESMRQLMAKGANVNAADMEGETPLIRAALMGHLDALMFLLKSGANINATSTSGTALHAAVVNNNGECIKELIKADADPHIPNKEGKTALKMVEEKSPQLLTFFDKNTNALRDEVDSLKAGLEEWKRRALEAESKYETSQKKLMQIYNELKEAEDGLKEEKKRTEELEQKVADETQKAAEASKQLEEQGKLKEEELRTLREECEKNKATADAGELFKISQEVMKLRERLNAAENASGELAGKLAHAKIEAEVESKLRKQADEKNRQMRSELQKLRLERGDENKLSFNTSEQALRQIEVIKRTFTSLQEVLRISEKSISHTNVQLDAFKKIVDRNRGTDEGADDDNEADDATATATENSAAEKSAQDDETQAGDVAGHAAVVEGGQREEGEPGPVVMVVEPKETETEEVKKTEGEEEEGGDAVAKAQQ